MHRETQELLFHQNVATLLFCEHSTQWRIGVHFFKWQNIAFSKWVLCYHIGVFNPKSYVLVCCLFEFDFCCISDRCNIGLREINEKLWGRNIRCIIHTSCQHLEYLSERKLLLYFSSGRQFFSRDGDRLITFNHNMIYESRNILPVVTYLQSPLTLAVMLFI